MFGLGNITCPPTFLWGSGLTNSPLGAWIIDPQRELVSMG